MDPLILVAGAGVLAGAMNALAGGGSFVSLPALIAAGVPPVLANTSSTVALYPGSMASAWAYRDSLGGVGDVPLKKLFLVTLLGGSIGALLLLFTSSRAFDFVLPWLLLVAMLALAFGRQGGEWVRAHCRVRPFVVMILQFGLGIYGGYFGGAVGIMMVAVWGLLGSHDLKRMAGPRVMMVTVANTMAVVIFIVAGAVQWRAAVVMLLTASLGGYLGALLGKRIPAPIIRFGTLTLTLFITITFFVRAYG
ncbi:sulfite exporter TauE/SafE family protein [Castellaniella sp. MT123]|uniref:sulfite exporter TauE/SafE family protein n=1 Tax=Castellaniella sp. MT123 TaxID=3140381 RepID=UPI0031F3E8F4|nr:sulfite exporter TauE/SafE family protein [Castellaniella sp.]